MARNEEKDQSMLNQFIAMKNEEKKKPTERRPFLASECRDLAEADKWRRQIMLEIVYKVAEIQNEGLGEHRLLDLNDEINKLRRERGHWDRRMVELGGPNDTKHTSTAYWYFGAARKLPGVRGFFEKLPQLKKSRTRCHIYNRIDANYFGYRDGEDGILEKLDGRAEERMMMGCLRSWTGRRKRG